MFKLASALIAMGLMTWPAFGRESSADCEDAPSRPNIVVILADDLGIGDAGACNSESKIPTPNLDRLAEAGVRFTDAHSPSAVCSPTRYAILTGRYAWRSRLKRWVLNGESRALIEPGRPTLASMLQTAGYRTACIGKWHLGLGRYDPENPDRKTDYDGTFDAGPHTIGFDEVFILPASADMPPYVYVRGAEVEQSATAETPGSKRRWSGGGGFWRSGPMAPDFEFDQILPRITTEAVSFISARRSRPDEPFFLYVALTAPHTPWVPTPEFHGRSEAGWYGDFVAQVDHSIGRILGALDEIGARDTSLVCVASDNGSHWRPVDIETYGHRANLDYRGMKADIHEGGHRVPFIVRWPGRVNSGSRSDALIGLHDLYATVAQIVGHDLGEDEAPDSVSFLSALTGSDDASIREPLIHHSGDGMFAIRIGRWKLIDGLGSGGFTAPARHEPGESEPAGQLFDLERDPREQTNLWSENPERVEQMLSELERIKRPD